MVSFVPGTNPQRARAVVASCGSAAVARVSAPRSDGNHRLTVAIDTREPYGHAATMRLWRCLEADPTVRSAGFPA